MDIPLTVRPLDPVELPDLEWTGSPQHLRAVANDLGRALAGDIAQLVVSAPNSRLVGFGAVDFTRDADTGRLWMLSVRPSWQSLGVGTVLIRGLEQVTRDHDRSVASIAVEHDNPRARALYLRLGYRSAGTELDSWDVAANQTYVTVTEVLRKSLA